MEKKSYLIAPGVTTRDALNICLAENARAFVIENPLYSEIYPCGQGFDCLGDYELDIQTDKQIILCRKKKGKNQFDNEHHALFYLPLDWENWHS